MTGKDGRKFFKKVNFQNKEAKVRLKKIRLDWVSLKFILNTIFEKWTVPILGKVERNQGSGSKNDEGRYHVGR